MATTRYSSLLQERAELRMQAAANLAEADASGRMDEKHRKADDKLNARLAEIQTEIDAEEIRRAENLAEFEARRNGEAGEHLSQRWAAGPRFAQAFPGQSGDTGGFKSLNDFLSGIQAGMWDQRYQALLTSSDGNGTALQIPTQFAAELFDMSLEGEVVRPRARIEPMTSDTKKIAGFTVGAGGTPFGISGGWTEEGGTIGESNPTTRAIQLNAHKLAALVQISAEAAADGTAIDRQLSEVLTKGLGWLLDDAFLVSGTGAGKPMSVVNAPCTVEVAKETGQAAATVEYANITRMLGRLHPACFSRSVWVVNPSCIPSLMELCIIHGTSGTAVPVLRESDGQFYLLTRPVIFSEKASPVGTKGDIMLCDFSQYAVGLRMELTIEKSAHLGFATDTVYYRAKIRADGMPIWHQPYSPDGGAPTLSPFVVLATRA